MNGQNHWPERRCAVCASLLGDRTENDYRPSSLLCLDCSREVAESLRHKSGAPIGLLLFYAGTASAAFALFLYLFLT